jgi:hypothetical protein
MARPPSQTRKAVKKDCEALDKLIERARRNDQRDRKTNLGILRRLIWVKTRLAIEVSESQEKAKRASARRP